MKFPDELSREPYHLRSLEIDGATVVESCSAKQFAKSDLLVSQHLLLFVLEGRYKVSFGNDTLFVEKGEGLLVQRTHSFHYEKIGNVNGDGKPFESLMFFFKDELIKDFLFHKRIGRRKRNESKSVSKISYNRSIQIFLQSVLVAFDSDLSQHSSFLQNKLFELLFNLSDTNPDLLSSFMNFTTYKAIDLNKVVEGYYRENLTLEELAYKAGRSLATFKREFQKIYNTSPHRWLLNRRLEYARDLIEVEGMNVSDASLHASFASVAHFSRAFKRKYNVSPSSLKEPVAVLSPL
ncbi:helix-turn-helix transcriptional regulator [Mucilaginibacter sp. SG564]|uniref:helix-turn-helix transcriptional regulator n=1 Tax=Mucilaginibacter sp. SG564 TaxID=2587022 RepID=UPI001553E383|nr:AraC family transcriptional regulator [Mucilaginibacter sp. SG564]NOW95069.1 AraC-like DNA-binding protein [Mucilaginibacter sp. SG564]